MQFFMINNILVLFFQFLGSSKLKTTTVKPIEEDGTLFFINDSL